MTHLVTELIEKYYHEIEGRQMGLNYSGAPARSRAPWVSAPCSFQEGFHGFWKGIFSSRKQNRSVHFLTSSVIVMGFSFFFLFWRGSGGDWLFSDFHGFWKGIFYIGDITRTLPSTSHIEQLISLTSAGEEVGVGGGGRRGVRVAINSYVLQRSSPARWCVNWLDNKWERTTDQIYDFYHL